MKEIGERIKILRKLNNITQEELAEQMSVSRQSVSKWESNQSVPDIEKIISLSAYFDTSTDYLLTGKKEETVNHDTPKESKEENKTKKDFALIISVIMISFSSISLFVIWVLSKVYRINNLPFNSETGLYRVGIDAFLYVHDIRDFYNIMVATLIFGSLLAILSFIRKRMLSAVNK